MFKKSDQVAALKRVTLFSSMSDRDLKAVHNACREEMYSNGQALVREGQTKGPFFIIIEGRAKVTVNGRTKRTLNPGDYFGEISLVDNGPRAATVVADGNVKALAMASWEFLALCEQNFDIARKLMMGMAAMIRGTNG